ncbi:UNVERIFIED_CONTAM: hypothetical protein RMT77_002581 [Armadillidium vulgare]
MILIHDFRMSLKLRSIFSSHLLCSSHLIYYVIFLTRFSSATTDECKGVESFEKVTRVVFSGPLRSELFTSQDAWDTTQCLTKCKFNGDCKGIELDYESHKCVGLRRNAENPVVFVKPVKNAVNSFEKICLNVPACSKGWMLERVVGFEIEGYDDLILEKISSRMKCAELCLKERGLQCKSVEFNEVTKQCRLSRQDRRTQPLSFKPAAKDIHYIENQCNEVKELSHCEYEEFKGQDLGQADMMMSPMTITECKDACEKETMFNCRSFSWVKSKMECRLSSDDQMSAGPSSVVPDFGSMFYQRSPCLDLELECSTDAMEVRLKTAEPFNGKLFSQDKPGTCETLGGGQRTTSLRIMFEDANCGVVDEGEGILSNVIVVQHHPIIQRRGDKSVKLMCLFQTSNRTVTNGFNIDFTAMTGAVATAVVNATAPSPKIRLRIVDRDGNDVSGVKLGDELYLRLDLDEESVYGILARNLVAKNKDNSDSIQLLDERGCPVDPLIFPSLQKVPDSKSLQGRFEAFKFSEDTVVKFQLNVQFCLEECTPADCGTVKSYGKRRRRRSPSEDDNNSKTLLKESEEEDPDAIYHEMPLQREIIVANSHVTPINNEDLDEDIHHLGDLVCTSQDILIAIIVASIILQICLILVAVMCVALRGRKYKESSSRASDLTLTLSRCRTRPSTLSIISPPSERSVNTLKSLRTSLRD